MDEKVQQNEYLQFGVGDNCLAIYWLKLPFMVESSESGFYLVIDYVVLFLAATISLCSNDFFFFFFRWIGIAAVKVSCAHERARSTLLLLLLYLFYDFLALCRAFQPVID